MIGSLTLFRHHGVTQSRWMRFDPTDVIDDPSGESGDGARPQTIVAT